MYRKIASVLISSFIIVRFSIVTQGHLLWTQSILLSCVYVCVFYTSFFSSTLILTRSFVPYDARLCLRVGWYRRQPDKNMIPADQLKFFWCNVQGVLLTKEGWTAVLFVCLARRVVLLKISGFARACICSYGLFILLRQCSCLCTAIILKELGHDEKGVRCTR